MSYQVFFVEDEIVTREGIRDNVDWQAHGFELCGEAPDGEVALRHLQSLEPEVLITDIKMPFMDGLQLARIVRERMPGTKIVILSGHDEFEYAQQAITLGVTEYLLKPVTVENMHSVLRRLATQLDGEREELEALRRLRQQVQESRATLIERLWFKLLVGAISLSDAVDECELLSLNLAARCYLAVLIRIVPAPARQRVEYSDYEQVQQLVGGIVGNDPDVFVLRKDLDELVLIMKGNTPGYLLEARDLLLEDYLKCGLQAELDEFFDTYILPIGSGCHSSIVRNYIVLDVVSTTARLIQEWGGIPDDVLPELTHIERAVVNVNTIEQIKDYVQPILNKALAFRDALSTGLHGGIIHQARDYIDRHYADPNISLHQVARRVGHSPSHFCTVFSEATGQTFKSYVTELRIKRAKELLRTTSLRTADISDQVGYNDPHYFSLVFRKSTQLSPKEFRLQAQRVGAR